MKTLDLIGITLLIVGGLNWGLVGLANFNLVAAVLGNGTLVATTVYALVGLSAIYQILSLKAIRQRWMTSPARS